MMQIIELAQLAIQIMSKVICVPNNTIEFYNFHMQCVAHSNIAPFSGSL